MPQFEIETYRVNTRRATPSRRRIELVSVQEFHGIRNRATLWFRDDSDLPGSLGTVFNYQALNFNGVTVVAYFPMSDYRDIYESLQTEKPVFLNYGVATGNTTTRTLTHIEIGTHPEPLGEGPTDSESDVGSDFVAGFTNA
jgi:hypothetical protein